MTIVIVPSDACTVRLLSTQKVKNTPTLHVGTQDGHLTGLFKTGQGEQQVNAVGLGKCHTSEADTLGF